MLKCKSTDDYCYYFRLVWAVFVVGALSYLVLMIFKNFQRYYSYPTTTLVTVKHVHSLDFPAVTLCNYNQVRRSKLDKDTEAFFQSIFGSSGRYRVHIVLICCSLRAEAWCMVGNCETTPNAPGHVHVLIVTLLVLSHIMCSFNINSNFL